MAHSSATAMIRCQVEQAGHARADRDAISRCSALTARSMPARQEHDAPTVAHPTHRESFNGNRQWREHASVRQIARHRAAPQIHRRTENALVNSPRVMPRGDATRRERRHAERAQVDLVPARRAPRRSRPSATRATAVDAGARPAAAPRSSRDERRNARNQRTRSRRPCPGVFARSDCPRG